MTKSASVVGIMIGAEHKDFRLYHMDETWQEEAQGGTHSLSTNSSDGWYEGLPWTFGNRA